MSNDRSYAIFKKNVDVLYEFMKILIYEKGQNKYKMAREWLYKNDYEEVYNWLSEQSFAIDDEIVELVREYKVNEKSPDPAGCFTVTPSTVKVDGYYLASNDSKTFERLDMLFSKLEPVKKIFEFSGNEYVFRKGDTIPNDVGKESKKKNKEELKDSNYEMLKEFLIKWVGKKTCLQESMNFKEYLYTISVLKSLVPPEFQIAKDSGNVIYKKGYDQYMEDFSVIDDCVFRHYINHTNDDWRKFDDSEWIDRYSHVLNAFMFSQSDIKEFISKITTLRDISVGSYSVIMSELNSRMYQNISRLTLRTEECIDECIKSDLHLENESYYLYMVRDFMDEQD